MNLKSLLQIAFKCLKKNKGRSFLTILGIIIGIAAIISTLAIGYGAEEKQRKEIPMSSGLHPMDLEGLISKAASTENQVEYAQLKEEILKALGQLPPRERAVIVERYYLGMSEIEMADTHEVAQGTVKWLLNAARKKMRAFIGTENDPL